MTEAADTGASSAGGPQPGRLAVIVAMDAAGYSRQSEIDQATAIREITALGERIRASASSRGGRIFNTAGDGFMLEFPSSAAAVAASEELQAVERVPLRIGIHIGEAFDTPSGDILGKGVNVAARLMTLAAPGGIVVSSDVKQQLPHDVTARLRRRGMVRLRKMAERTEIFELGSPWRRPRPKPWMLVAAGAGAVALIVLLWTGAQSVLQPGSRAVAVLEFRTLDPNLQTFAAGLADRLIGAMSTNELQPIHTTATADGDRIGAAAAAGAAFVLDGSLRPESDALLVSARLVDTRDNVAIWSNEYRRASSEQDYLQEQIAFDVARVLRCALIGSGQRAEVDSATLSVFMRACQGVGGGSSPEEAYQAARQVTQRAPRFSRGWSMLGTIAAAMSWQSGEVGEAYAAEARDAAARARQLDRRNGEGFLIEASLFPQPDLRTRDALIARALEADPDLAAAHAAQAWFYLEVGRAREALQAMERAVAIEPLNGDYQSSLVPLRNGVGDHIAAQEQTEWMYRVWPHSPDAWWNRLMNASYNADPAEGLHMLANVDAAPPEIRPMLPPPVLTRWRAFLVARQSGDPARMRRAAHALRELIPGRFSRSSGGAALSLSGDVDAALEMAEGVVSYSTSGFFLPPWRNLRRDPRFMTLIRDTGLIQYWRETGRWPDFCGERDLPYDCETEAARALPP